MWKWTGSPASCATDHSGSQWRSPRYGSPKRCGSPVKRMPRWPASRLRSISLTDSSTSQNGSDMIGEQPARVGRGPVAQEVVVRADAHELQLVVADAEEALAAEAGDVRVEHLGPDPDLVHVLEARLGVVRGAGGTPRRSAGPAGNGSGQPATAVSPGLLNGVPSSTQTSRPSSLRSTCGTWSRYRCGHPSRPHVGRLGDVRVGVDDELRHAATVRQCGEIGIRAQPTWNSEHSRARPSSTTS